MLSVWTTAIRSNGTLRQMFSPMLKCRSAAYVNYYLLQPREAKPQFTPTTIAFYSSDKADKGDPHGVSHDELLDLLKTEGLSLIDVRETQEIKAGGKIPGALHIPLNELEVALSLTANQFKEKYGVCKPKADGGNLVFYCEMGQRSSFALNTAHAKGFREAKHYGPGFQHWSKQEGPEKK